MAETHEFAGPVDILIGNAGVNVFYGAISEISDEVYEKTLATNNVQANLWLARISDASRYMTGQALTVCGGTHMWA